VCPDSFPDLHENQKINGGIDLSQGFTGVRLVMINYIFCRRENMAGFRVKTVLQNEHGIS